MKRGFFSNLLLTGLLVSGACVFLLLVLSDDTRKLAFPPPKKNLRKKFLPHDEKEPWDGARIGAGHAGANAAADGTALVPCGSHDEDARFFPFCSMAGTSMTLRGIGIKKVFLVRVFSAGFFLEEGVLAKDALRDVAKRVEVEYFVHIPAAKLSAYTIDMMRRNTTEKEYMSFADGVERMIPYLVDINPGDRYALSYVPGQGTLFELNGKMLGVIQGKAFARALFAVWVGEQSMDKQIKLQILGLS